MNFPLKNLELHIPEAALVVGEQLYEEQQISSLKEIERNLWLATIDQYEIEVQITPSKVRAFTCDCGTFKHQKVCGHIVATLLSLRKLVHEKKLHQRAERIRRTLPRKLTTASIIENITEEELVGFIKNYAKRNRQFALALKARFASAVPIVDSRQKYLDLIDATIKTHRLKNDTISYRGYQRLTSLGKELLGQVDDAFALENYSEGLIIIQCIIEKYTPVISKIKEHGTSLLNFVQGSFLRIEKLLTKKTAPALKEQIWVFCLTESVKLTYQEHHLNNIFFQILLSLANNEKKLNSFEQIIDNELNKPRLSNSLKANLLFIKLNIFHKQGKEAIAETFILRHMSNPEFALFVVQKSLEEGNYLKAKQFAENALVKSTPVGIKQDLEEALYQIHVVEKDTTKIIYFGQKRLLNTKLFHYYQTLKENYEGDWSIFSNTILERLTNAPFSKEKRDLIAQIYVSENKIPELITYIENFQSIELLLKFDEHLIAKHHKILVQFYQQFLGNYLENHIGKKPTERVKKVMNHLYESGQTKLAQKLSQYIRDKHGHRHYLMAVLDSY